uniref:Uncharacterized protein n=1 Tax=Arundo donax TaxID=35708 RepID=A0A0A8XTY3_ARUDO
MCRSAAIWRLLFKSCGICLSLPRASPSHTTTSCRCWRVLCFLLLRTS